MALVVILTLILLIALLGLYIIVERNREKAREAQRRAFNNRVKAIQQRFSAVISDYASARILRPKNTTTINAICSNFFVVQNKTPEKLEYLEYITDRVINTLQSEFTKADARQDIEGLTQRMQRFVQDIPHRGIEFNQTFYQEILPSLLTSLTTPELSIEEKALAQKTEQDAQTSDATEQKEPAEFA
ncbi:hypothetical protein AAEU32_01040 [Pseudoalteromonas sp. SSDWG2]|uniref:hypothetical protein n=1 Tax=Pseudoalteromonas sp. SSDWG2 TaxID=3139391 RepID=UPI003BAB3879